MILQPAKVATPALAFVGFAVQVRVAPAGVVMFRVMERELLVLVLPPASWTVTTGWVPKAMPLGEFEGLVVKPSMADEHKVMVTLLLTALVSPAEAAVSV